MKIDPRDGSLHSNSRAAASGALEEVFADAFRSETAGALEAAERGYRVVVERAGEDVLRARALLRLSHVHRSWGAWAEGERLAERGRALARKLGDPTLEAECLNARGAILQARADFEESDRLFRGILGLTDDPRVRGIALQNLGVNAAMQKRFAEGEEMFARSVACFKAAGYGRGEAFALNNRGRVLLDQGKASAAREVLEQATVAAQRVDDLDLHALAVMNLAEAHLQTGSTPAAGDCAVQALGYFMAEENPGRVVECLRIQGDIARAIGERAESERCYRRALQLARDLGARRDVELLESRLAAPERPGSREPGRGGGQT